KKSRRRTNTVVSRRAFVPNSLEDCDMTVLANYAMLLAQAGSGDSAWSLLQHSSLVFWTAIALICIVPSIAHYWWKVRKAEMEAALKQEMIRQGMSADDIQKVLDAGKTGKCGD